MGPKTHQRIFGENCFEKKILFFISEQGICIFYFLCYETVETEMSNGHIYTTTFPCMKDLKGAAKVNLL
jgi:hypothetical protein